MEIRDVIHGAIEVENNELALIDSRYFQRLRHIKQLGFSEHSYPSANHNRYIHSLGAMATATKAIASVFQSAQNGGHLLKSVEDFLAFRKIVRLAALLHDIGHGPLSHTTEFAMPAVAELRLPIPIDRPERKATHEDYTLKIILDSGLSPAIQAAGKQHGFSPRQLASLIDDQIPLTQEERRFFIRNGIDFQPLLQQIISSELDADRMDYLQRDTYYCGVRYGDFDFDWIISNLTAHVREQKCYLGLEHRALYSFEDFLISRYHMFLMVYFHHKGVIYDEMLALYFNSVDEKKEQAYRLPADIEAYCDCNDAHLFSHLQKSQNPFARRIVDQNPYKMLMEIHSKIPNDEKIQSSQAELLHLLCQKLENEKIPFIHSTSIGELSKYFRRGGTPIYVRYNNRLSEPTWIPLEKCTDLFARYSDKRTVTRVYVSPESYERSLKLGRQMPQATLSI